MGNIKNESDFYPWGGELQLTANDPNNHYKFTGKERDTETGLDYFGARYYSNGLGRFITPDWAAKATAVPYAEFADPPKAPDNLVTPGGDVIPIPKGASAVEPVTNDSGRVTGFAFKGGSGGHGFDGRVAGVRIMDPTDEYQSGYAVYMNKTGQKVNPYTGRTISDSDPWAHVPLSPPKPSLPNP